MPWPRSRLYETLQGFKARELGKHGSRILASTGLSPGPSFTDSEEKRKVRAVRAFLWAGSAMASRRRSMHRAHKTGKSCARARGNIKMHSQVCQFVRDVLCGPGARGWLPAVPWCPEAEFRLGDGKDCNDGISAGCTMRAKACHAGETGTGIRSWIPCHFKMPKPPYTSAYVLCPYILTNAIYRSVYEASEIVAGSAEGIPVQWRRKRTSVLHVGSSGTSTLNRDPLFGPLINQSQHRIRKDPLEEGGSVAWQECRSVEMLEASGLEKRGSLARCSGPVNHEAQDSAGQAQTQGTNSPWFRLLWTIVLGGACRDRSGTEWARQSQA